MGHAGSDGDVPSWIESQVLAAVDGAPAERKAALGALKAKYPGYADEIAAYVDDAATRQSVWPRLESVSVLWELGRDENGLLQLGVDERGERQSSASGSNARYRILEEIGRGGVGIVFRGFDRDLGRDVALKFLRKEFAASARVAERFIEEAQIGGQLQHPGITPVFELGIADGAPFFAMELVDGSSLVEILQEREDLLESRLDLVATVAQVARAVAYAHDRGVVHRDLKPANILIGSFGEVRVVDWGMGKVVAEVAVSDSVTTVRSGAAGMNSMLGSVLGTPAYMAPEQARGEVDLVGPHTDVFAIGAILCEIVCGRPPYDSSAKELTADEAIERAAKGDLSESSARIDASDVDPDLKQLVRSCLEPDIALRLPQAGEVVQQIDAYMRAIRTRAEQAVFAAASARQIQRRTTWMAGAIAVALIVSLALWLVAESHLGRYNQVKMVVQLDNALEAERVLYPAHPASLPAMRAWLAQHGTPLVDGLHAVQGQLAALVALQKPSPADVFLRNTLEELVVRLERFAAPDGVVDKVRQRMQWAQSVQERSIERYQEQWQRATQAIAAADGVSASSLYGGSGELHLPPQMGLVPIGANPKTGLWEFYHLGSAADPDAPAPKHHPETGVIKVTEATGVVFVLLPGGMAFIGAQSSDPAKPNYEVTALDGEAPPTNIEFAPFFIARHEVTQAQWTRWQGSNPSYHRAGLSDRRDGLVTLTHPVDQVSWSDCDRVLNERGLMLPTEAQWEYAARAGTITPWWTGGERDSLLANGIAVNLADRSALEAGADWGDCKLWPEAFDGFVGHAPVDGMLANPWGLHCMHGNMTEHCADFHCAYTLPARPGDGLREPADRTEFRVRRGGSFGYSARRCRSAVRTYGQPLERTFTVGVRAARAVRFD